jgi:hypothetical protein
VGASADDEDCEGLAVFCVLVDVRLTGERWR